MQCICALSNPKCNASVLCQTLNAMHLCSIKPVHWSNPKVAMQPDFATMDLYPTS